MSGRLRLLLTTDAVGGVWTYSLDLARTLADSADAVVLLAVLGPAPGPDQLARAAAVPGLQLVQTGLPLDWTAREPGELRAASAALGNLAVDGRVFPKEMSFRPFLITLSQARTKS